MRIFVVVAGAGVALLAACGFGTYGDTGSPEPGPWWPWVCPDSGDLAPEGGCEEPDGAEADGCADGGDGGCR